MQQPAEMKSAANNQGIQVDDLYDDATKLMNRINAKMLAAGIPPSMIQKIGFQGLADVKVEKLCEVAEKGDDDVTSGTAIFAIRIGVHLFLAVDSMVTKRINGVIYQIPYAYNKIVWISKSIVVAGAGSGALFQIFKNGVTGYLGPRWETIMNMYQLCQCLMAYAQAVFDWALFDQLSITLVLVGNFNGDPSIYIMKRVDGRMICNYVNMCAVSGSGAPAMRQLQASNPVDFELLLWNPSFTIPYLKHYALGNLIHAVLSNPLTCGRTIQLVSINSTVDTTLETFDQDLFGIYRRTSHRQFL